MGIADGVAADYQIPEEEIRRKALNDGITHLSTGVAVVRDGKILAVRRSAGDFLGGNYELPGGGIDAGETILGAVTRELLEETGLHVRKVIGAFPGIDYTTPVKPKVRQFNFLVEVADGEVKLSSEHDTLSWFDKTTVHTLPTTKLMLDCLVQALRMIGDA